MNLNRPWWQTIALARLKPSAKRRALNNMTWLDMSDMDAEFERWVHEGQIAPPEHGWRTWLMLAGRGFGKTRAGAEWVEKIARSRPGVRIALAGATIDEARRVMVEGVSGVLSVAKRRRHRVKWEPSLGRLTWPNGSEAQIFSGDNPDGFRGPEHDFAWFLTFEVIADTAAVSAGSVLRQVSGGVIASDDANAVIGYAAHGPTMSSAVDQFVQVLGIDLFDDGSSLSSPGLEITAVDQRQAGCGADQKMRPAIERSQDAAANVPTALSLSYYDVDRDYQAGLARASIDAMLPSTQQVELPAVLEAGSAKALAQSALARRWAERDKLTLRLPPAYLSLRPGALIQLSAEVGLWRIQAVLVDSLAVVVDLRPVYATAIDLVAADSGRVLQSPPIVAEPTKLSLVELPDDGTGSADTPVVAVAASGGSTWRAVPLAIEAGEASFTVQSSRRAGVTGVAVGILPEGPAELFDLRNSVDVRLNDPTAWLESRDDDALAAGANLAMLGRELTQFGDALPLGDGAFRLSRLLRGRRGTEWAMAGHGAGDEFVLVDASRLLILPLTRAQVGASVRVTPMGLADSGAAPVQISVSGEAMRPPAPSHVRTWFDAAGNLNCTWVRRSNLGWDWLDGVDAPLGCASERYSVSLQGSTSSIQIETASPEAQFTADQVNALGDPALNLVIAQIGDFAVSRPAVVPISTI